MSLKDEAVMELCRKLLKRAAWRIQYKIRTQQVRECASLLDYQAFDYGFEKDILSEIYVKELVGKIPWKKSRYVIQRTIIEGLTEKEVAQELQITQQAVNKWKKKGLEAIRQSLCHSSKL
ncbi:MAG: sigma-70 family RNA polymerase sigma factor [Bacillota bacterium]